MIRQPDPDAVADVYNHIYPAGSLRECEQAVFDRVVAVGVAGGGALVAVAAGVGAGTLMLGVVGGVVSAGYLIVTGAHWLNTPLEERSISLYVPSFFKGRVARALAGGVSAFFDPGPGGRAVRLARMTARTVCVAAPLVLSAWLWAPSALWPCVGAAACAGMLAVGRACTGDRGPAVAQQNGRRDEGEPVEDVPVEDEPVEDEPVDDEQVEDEPVDDEPVEDMAVESDLEDEED